jgi:hypothetical protein
MRQVAETLATFRETGQSGQPVRLRHRVDCGKATSGFGAERADTVARQPKVRRSVIGCLGGGASSGPQVRMPVGGAGGSGTRV